MDFFEQQEAARKRTGRLALLVALAVVATVLMTCLAVCFAWTLCVFLDDAQNTNDFWAVFRSTAVETSVGFMSAFTTLAVVSCAFLWRHHTLRRGGAAVAEAMVSSCSVPLEMVGVEDTCICEAITTTGRCCT